MKKELTVNEYWNGINIGDYKVKMNMDKSCSIMEDVGKNGVRFDGCKYKELEDKLNEYFNTYDKILLNIPFGSLTKRIKQLTEKLGLRIEKTTSLKEVTENYERVYVVLTR
jgi:hypothetical protein